MLTKWKPYLYLVSTFFFWASVYVVSKMVTSVPAILVSCLRCAIASAALLLMAKKYWKVKIESKDKKYFLMVGCLGYFMTVDLVQFGIRLTGASVAALINALTPVTVTIVAAFLLKEKITPVKGVCMILAVAGTIIITTGTSGKGELLGILLCLTSIILWAFASVFMRRLTAVYPPIMVTAYCMTLSLLFHIPAGILSVVQAGGETGLNAGTIIGMLYLGLIGCGLAHFCWTKSLSLLPASTCSLFYPLQPMFAAVMGYIFLNESFAPTFFIGLLLISVDVVLSTWETHRLSKQSDTTKK